MKKYKIIILLQYILIGLLIYEMIFSHRILSYNHWFRETSVDEQYTLLATMEEYDSLFSKPYYKIELNLYDNKKSDYPYIISFIFSFDGKQPTNKNYEINWYSDYVKIIIKNESDKIYRIRIYYEDLQ